MKTHEMLRDIREGETYEVASGRFEGSSVTFARYGNYASKALVWNKDRYLEDIDTFVPTTEILANYEWRKRTPATVVVDFAKAFAAYEKGATIRPEKSSANYSQGTGCVFHPADIRGKWIVEGDAEYWWE